MNKNGIIIALDGISKSGRLYYALRISNAGADDELTNYLQPAWELCMMRANLNISRISSMLLGNNVPQVGEQVAAWVEEGYANRERSIWLNGSGNLKTNLPGFETIRG